MGAQQQRLLRVSPLWTTLFALILGLSFVACSTSGGFVTGGGNVPNYQFPTVTDGDGVTSVSLDGTAAYNWSNQTSASVNVGGASEYSLWVNCTGSLNVSNISYTYSMDNLLFTNGATTLPGCFNNFTKTDLTDKGMAYMRFAVKSNASLISNESKFANTSIAYPSIRLLVATR